MRILLAFDRAEHHIPSIVQNSMKNMQFDYQTDILKLIDTLETQEFSMYDKLVVILSSLKSWDDIQAKTILSRYTNWAKTQPTEKEIIFIDTDKKYYVEVATEILGYPNIRYIGERVRVTELPAICAGQIHAQSNAAAQPLVKDKSRRKVAAQEVPKPRKGFGFLGRKNKQEAVQSDSVEPITPIEIPEPTQDFSQHIPLTEPEQNSTQDFSQHISLDKPESEPAQNFDQPIFTDMPTPVNTMNDPYQSELSDVPLEFPEDVEIQSPKNESRFGDVYTAPDVNLFDMPQPEPQPEPQYQPPQPQYQDPQPQYQPQPEPQPQYHQPQYQSPQPNVGVPVQQPSSAPLARPNSRRQNQRIARRSAAILVTGDRRSGVSSIVSNLAMVAAMNGESVLVLDFDFERRGQSINFPVTHESQDIRYTTSLSNALRTPGNIQNYAMEYIPGLWYLGTSITVGDTRPAAAVVDNHKIQRLIGTALSQYDLVLIDAPFNCINDWDALVTSATRVIHVMNNDLSAIMNNINLLCEDAFEDTSIYQTYIPKMSIVLNALRQVSVGGVPADANNIMDIFAALTEDYETYLDFNVAGQISFNPEYDAIIASDKQPAETKYAPEYEQILQAVREV